jgi:hypothetical protein
MILFPLWVAGSERGHDSFLFLNRYIPFVAVLCILFSIP